MDVLELLNYNSIVEYMLLLIKEFLPHSVKDDVNNEARLLTQLCHPYLPYLFGVTTESQPYRIVMQFHGLIDHSHCTL